MPIPKLRGVIAPIATPLCDGDRVDVPGLRRLTRYLLEAGVHGLCANDSMGGFAFLTDAEQIRAIETVVDEVNGWVPVVAGLGETSTSRAKPRAREMERCGVQCLSVMSPFYFFTSQEQLRAYFSEIADAVDVPIIIYDNPISTKNAVHPETIAELRRRVPNLVGVKEANPDVITLQRLIDFMRGDDEFSILIGNEFLIHVGLLLGADGCIAGLHNICPQLAVELYQAFLTGDQKTARDRQSALADCWRIFHYGQIWGAFDEAMRYLGICERAAGAPYITALSEEETRKVREILQRHVKSPSGI